MKKEANNENGYASGVLFFSVSDGNSHNSGSFRLSLVL